MTREEQTKREAEVYGWTGSQFDIQTAFIRGANWADETLLEKIEAYLKANYNMPENFMVHLKKNIFNY